MTGRLGATPTADVLEIEDVVKQVLAGRIRVPQFQRPLRWGRSDALKLFDSIIRGYPIGGLLFWERGALADTLHVGALRIDAPELQSAYWLVDGQQRVTTLANVLTESTLADDRFALDLRLPEGDIVAHASSRSVSIPLPILFDLQKLLVWFRENPNADEYFELATDVAKRIRQYKIPVSIVPNQDEAVLRDIFDRLNSYGKRLTRAEVFTALSPSESPNRVDLIADRVAADLGFGKIDGNLVVQVVLARRGPDINREIRNEFDDELRGTSEFPEEGAEAAYDGAELALVRAVQFLQNNAGVPHIAFLPYKYLLVVLARVFAHHPELSDRERHLLRRWFWRAAVAGPGLFPGASTGAVRVLSTLVKPDDLGETLRGLLSAVPRSAVNYPDVTQFRANSGPGKSIACAMWSLNPRSFASGELIEWPEIAEVLGDSRTPRAAMVPLFGKGDVREELGESGARWLFWPEHEAADVVSLVANRPQGMAEGLWEEILRSHAMLLSASSLANNDLNEFAHIRTAELRQCVTEFFDASWEFEFEDTLPIDHYIIDDISDAE